MGYVDENLVKDERVIYETHLSWWAMLNLVTVLLSVVLVGIPLIFIWLRRSSSEFVVTNKRVMIKVGVISRRTLELNLAKVESITVDQGIGGRMFNFGDITIVGTGGTKEPFQGIARPMAFRKAAQEGIDAATSGTRSA
jgi:uncharacterized membrane protein YdbT with pleckstrin-like domain